MDDKIIKIIKKALNINKQKGFFMKTNNLIITFGLCSLLLSPAYIFGMERFKKGKKAVKAGKKAFKRTLEEKTYPQDNDSKKIPSIIITKHGDEKEKLDQQATGSEDQFDIILESDSDGEENMKPQTVVLVEPSPPKKNNIATFFFDLYRGIQGNVIEELKADKFNHTSNLERIYSAINKCLKCKKVTSLTEILRLCNEKQITVTDINIIDLSCNFLTDKKKETQKAFTDNIDKNYTNGSKLLNENLENLFIAFANKIKAMEIEMVQYTTIAHEEFTRHDNTTKQIEDALLYISTEKIKLSQTLALECTDNKKKLADFFSKAPQKKDKQSSKINNNYEFSKQMEENTKLILGQLKTISNTLNRLPSMPPIKAIEYKTEI